ncbi:polyprenyl synthetase family protein [Hwanghaeella sp.]|uniref:polyprenyl synthetase family protein n=1 Tax=Hwanghaeella sp. TaxID=2605943 RepID=UPI003CCC024B
MGIVVGINKDRESGRKPSIDALQRLVGEDLQKVNQHILTHMQSPVALIPQLASHLIAAGGKRLRPMLTLAAANLCGYTGTRHIGLSACVEFIHTATLLHDDVVDESELRRGQESANAVWGNQASVLVGDFLFSRAFQLMVADGSLSVLKILSDASAVIAEGEVLQLMTANDPQASEEAYLEVIRSKTATLFAAASRVGAVVADRPSVQEEALESFGMNLGIAFQLIDDVLDYSAKQAQLGKTVGDDFREGKVTLPLILAWRRGSEEEREFWRRTIERLDQTEDDLETAIGLMTKHRSLNDTVERARHYASIAKDSLGIFPDGDMKSAMLEVVDFCVERAY